MPRKYPSSLLIASYLSAIMTFVFVGISLFSSTPTLGLLVEGLSFFGLTLVLVTIVLEYFVYQRIRDLQNTKELEIHKLKKLENFRREFIGDVSHELKTPIFAIEGFVETLLDGALEDKKVNRKFLLKVLKHAERLNNLVQDILVITQIESGDIHMKFVKFDIYELAREIEESLENKFSKKGRNITATVFAEGGDACIVRADRQRIDQVLYNLIDNAVKYGDPNGLIRIKIRRKGPKFEVRVEDNGPGIAHEHQIRIFERFYRVDKSRSRERGGTGLGLSICKHLIEAHNEKIWVESQPGKGTTFIFTLEAVG